MGFLLDFTFPDYNSIRKEELHNHVVINIRIMQISWCNIIMLLELLVLHMGVLQFILLS